LTSEEPVQQAPVPASSEGFKTAFATCFSQNSEQDNCSNPSIIPTADKTSTGNCKNRCIALPSTSAKNRKVTVCTLDGVKCVDTIVGDTGPWCIYDDDYVFGNERPLAEQLKGKKWAALSDSQKQKCAGVSNVGWKTQNLSSNGAGIDLTRQIMTELEVGGDPSRDQVKWKFID